MKMYLANFIETIVVVVVYLLLRLIINRAIHRASKKDEKSENRVKIVAKVVNFILIVLSSLFIFIIWGVKQSDIVVFATSIVTVIGIAFFAQWSIISNITSAFIIFFNHPAKIGDEIEIFDKDYPVKGTIEDIGIFFITIHSHEGQVVTVPSNIFIQKMVLKKE